MYSNYRKRRCSKVGGVTVRGGRGGSKAGRSGARRDGRGGTERRATGDDGGGRRGMWTRGTGTEVSVRRRTWTGQECRRGGGHGQSRSVGVEADTGRAGVSARRRTRTGQECRRGGGHGQDRTDDNMTVSKHKLIREEKRERKQNKREEDTRLYTGRDWVARIIQQQSNKEEPRALD